MITTIRIRACLLAALAAPGLALAGPAEQPNGHAQLLGTVEALLQHCAKIQANEAPQFMKAGKRFTGGADDETLASVRSSDAYQAARTSALEALAQASDADIEQACAQYLPPTPAPAAQ